MKISIITPSYNQVQFIERTIQSVLQQVGDFELEYIIIDGGSTDGSIDIIKKYANQDKRIMWKSELDTGQSNAINKGLCLASGEIVAFLNSDDIYYPGALQIVVEQFHDYPATQWVTGRCRIINESNQEIKRWITRYKNFFLQKSRYSTLLILNYISQPATFWRKSIMDTIGYVNEQEHMVMDYEFWLRIGKKFKLYTIQEYLAGFRSYQNNKSSLRFTEQFHSEYRIATKYTHNPILLLLHKIHTWCIIVCYKVASS